MTVNTTWSDLKQFIDSNTLSIQWICASNTYYLTASKELLEVTCIMPMTEPPSADQLDFEENYKNR